MATVSPSSASHMFSGLTSFTQYIVTIVAVDSMGREGDSSTITVTTDRAGTHSTYLSSHYIPVSCTYRVPLTCACTSIIYLYSSFPTEVSPSGYF